MYCLTYLLFKINSSEKSDDENLDRHDAPKFMYMSIFVIGVGIVFQIIFHVGTNEKALLNDDEIHEHEEFTSKTEERRKWTDYIRCPKFYTVNSHLIKFIAFFFILIFFKEWSTLYEYKINCKYDSGLSSDVHNRHFKLRQVFNRACSVDLLHQRICIDVSDKSAE